MPTTIPAMPEPGHDTRPKYDWSKILDGEVHHFGPSEVPSTPRNFAKQVEKAARKRGLMVRVIARKRQGVYVQRLP